MKRFICDRYGQEYQLVVHEDSDDFFSAELRYRGEWIGKIECKFDLPDIMVVEDLEIRNDSDSEPAFHRMRAKSNPINYRGRGLGTALLGLAVTSAKGKGVKHIYGSIVQKDINKTPNIVEFYERRGFKKVAHYPGCLANAVAYICMVLS